MAPSAQGRGSHRMKTLHSRISVGAKALGKTEPVFIIAEIGVNHFGNIERAKHLIDVAVIAGADAVKFQIFRTENLIASIAPDWRDRLRPKELPFDAFRILQDYAVAKGILFFATAHDDESFEFLCSLNPLVFKIGSGEVSNPEYLRTVARQRKPVILSTGMYDMTDVRNAVEIFLDEGNQELALLHCITSYPPVPEDINLRAIVTMQEVFGCPVGYSDHTIGNDMSIAAVAVGAQIIEKHIAVSKNAPGSQDCPVSCDERDLIELVNSIRKVEKARGSGVKEPSERELKSREWARKSVVAKRTIPAGTIITRDMLTLKRPGTGIDPTAIDAVVGKKAVHDIEADALLSMTDIS